MVWLVFKVLAGLLGVVVLAVLLYFGPTLVRKSNTFVLRSDLEQMAASGISAEIASEICGAKVDLLRGVNRSEPNGYFPKASVLSWRPFFPMEGTVSVRMVGVGCNRVAWDRGGGDEAVTGPCEGTITFRYRCRWEDNGRAVVLDTRFVEGPTFVRGR
jgi:hypothetical protein